MNLIRTILFTILFYGSSVILVGLVPLVALLGGNSLRTYAMAWVGVMTWLARWILGIRVRIEGEIPKGPVLFAGKHEAIFEAMELSRLLGSPATVMKRELARIPLWGWAARRYGVIIADRAANAAALRSMMKDAKAALAEGRSVLIFPEGTRVKLGEKPGLRSGFAGLYRMLNLPVVPIAVRSGHVWPKHGIKKAGVVTFRFLDPIPPGLPRAEIEARVHAGINALNG